MSRGKGYYANSGVVIESGGGISRDRDLVVCAALHRTVDDMAPTLGGTAPRVVVAGPDAIRIIPEGLLTGIAINITEWNPSGRAVVQAPFNIVAWYGYRFTGTGTFTFQLDDINYSLTVHDPPPPPNPYEWTIHWKQRLNVQLTGLMFQQCRVRMRGPYGQHGLVVPYRVFGDRVLHIEVVPTEDYRFAYDVQHRALRIYQHSGIEYQGGDVDMDVTMFVTLVDTR